MLAAAERVRNRADFTEVVRMGRRAGRGSLVVHLLLPSAVPGDQPGPTGGSGARAGFIVSKAVGNAVTRNRVRRRLRHLVRSRLAALPGGALLVVRALPPAAGASSAGLAVDLHAALSAAVRAADRRSRGTSGDRSSGVPRTGPRTRARAGDAR